MNEPEKHSQRRGDPDCRPVSGPDLVLPLLGSAFAVYYLFTIAGLPREAQIGGIFSAGGVLILSAVIVVRSLARVARAEADFSLSSLWRPMNSSVIRVLLLVLLAGFILLFERIGLTATVFLFLVTALPLAGLRSPLAVLTISLVVAAAAYVVFVALLPTQFPEGPLETWLATVV